MPNPILDALDEVQGVKGPDVLAILDEVQQQTSSRDTRSGFAKTFDAVFTPPEAVTRAANRIAERVDAPSRDRSPLRARIEGFVAGAAQGVGSLLTPGDAVLTALGMGPAARAVQGVRGGARAVRGVQQAANLATAVR